MLDEQRGQHGEPGVIAQMRAQMQQAAAERERMAAEIAALTADLTLVMSQMRAQRTATDQIFEDGRVAGYRLRVEEERAQAEQQGMTRARHAKHTEPGERHLRAVQGLAVPALLGGLRALRRNLALTAASSAAVIATAAWTLTPFTGHVPRPPAAVVAPWSPVADPASPDPASPATSSAGTAPAAADPAPPAPDPSPSPSPSDSAASADPTASPSPSDSTGNCAPASSPDTASASVSASAGPADVQVQATVPPVPDVPGTAAKAPGTLSDAMRGTAGSLVNGTVPGAQGLAGGL